MIMRYIVHVAFVFLALFLSSCGAAVPPGHEVPCTPHERSCNGDYLIQCNANGDRWLELRHCEGGCQNGVCVQVGASCPEDQDCTGLDCGPDPVCGVICGTCGDDQTCEDGVCVQVGASCPDDQDCTGLQCGPDPVCGVVCGICSDDQTCDNGVCVQDGASCPGDQDCTRLECGPDPVCGMSCGTCGNGQICEAGTCVEEGTGCSVCNPGTIDCDAEGNVVQCDADGCDWTVIETCPADAPCSGGACGTGLAPCDLPWGGAIPHGETVTAYEAPNVSCGETCESATLQCNDGVLSPEGYSYPDCQPPRLFVPNQATTRQAMSAFLYRLSGEPTGPFPAPGFSDVPTSHPFYTEISWMVHEGITVGFTDGTFRPAEPAMRGAVAMFLYRLAGSPSGTFPDPGFPDVTESQYFYTAVSWMAHEGMAEGFPDGTFRPNEPATRGAVAMFLYRYSGEPNGALPEPGFSDVTENQYFYTAVSWMAHEGIAEGFACDAVEFASCGLPWGGTIAHDETVTAYEAPSVSCGETCESATLECSDGILSPDGYDYPACQPPRLFEPNRETTRQAMAAFLYRLSGEPAGPFPDPGFPDVPTSHPFYTEISWLVHEGITLGFPDGTFRPSEPATRGAVAMFLYRFAGEPSGPFPDPGFSDVSEDRYYYDAVAWMAHEGMAVGFPDGTFQPNEPATRGAVAVFLYRYSGEPNGSIPDPGFSDVTPDRYYYAAVAWMANEGIAEGFPC